MLILIVGPSGAGKDTLLNGVRDALAEVTGQRFDIASSVRQGGVDALSPGNAASRACGKAAR